MLACPFLPLWAETRGGDPVLVNRTENHTYFVNGHVLRIHPPSRSRAALEDELNWLRELRTTGLPLPEQIGAIQQAAGRHGVLFRFVAGSEPQPEPELYRTLGRYAAVLHLNRGQGTNRPTWDERLLDVDGPWGDWRRFGDLREVEDWLRTELAAYGKEPDRFGLIHADMRLANVIRDGSRVTLIDFDDCGHGWLMYDFAAAVSFIETNPRLPEWRDAWLAGYREVRPLGEEHVAILPAMILLRRMALCAWMVDHADTVLARTHAPGFAEGTLALFKRARSGALFRPA